MSCPLIEEVWADEHEEPRLPATEEGALADLFDNELDWLFLLLNFMQTRTQILNLIEELRILTRRINNITCGLKQN